MLLEIGGGVTELVAYICTNAAELRSADLITVVWQSISDLLAALLCIHTSIHLDKGTMVTWCAEFDISLRIAEI